MRFDATLFGIVMVAVGMSFLAGALLTVGETQLAGAPAYTQEHDPAHMGYPGDAFLATVTRANIQLPKTQGWTINDARAYLHSPGGTIVQATLHCLNDVEGGWDRTETATAATPMSAGWVVFDLPDIQASAPSDVTCTLTVDKTLTGGKFYAHRSTEAGAKLAFALNGEFAASGVAGGPGGSGANGTGGLGEPATPPTDDGEGGCEAGLVEDAAGVCVKAPADLVTLLLWGIILLLVVFGALLLLLGLFG